MSIEALHWAIGCSAGHPLSRWLLVAMADVADAEAVTTANLERLCAITEIPLRSLHHHLKQLQSRFLITPILGPIDQHGTSAIIAYRLSVGFTGPYPVPSAKSALRAAPARPAPLPAQTEARQAAETEAHDPGGVANVLTVAPGSRAWWAVFWAKIAADLPTIFMVTEGEQGHPWSVTLDELPLDEDERVLVECSEEQAAAWEIWLSGKDARFPQHALAENPGIVFAPHPWPRELL